MFVRLIVVCSPIINQFKLSWVVHDLSRSIGKPTTWSKFPISAFLQKNFLLTLNNHYLKY